MRWIRSSALLALLLFPGQPWAGTGPGELLAGYRAIADRLSSNPYGLPIHVQSEERDDLLSAEVYGVLDYPFPLLREAIRRPAAWCEFAPLTLNVKSCVHWATGDQELIRFYVGRKFYEPPEDTYPIDYRFRRETVEEDYLSLSLVADRGPLGGSDFVIDVEALPVEAGTLVRIRSSYRPSFFSRVTLAVYLATLGRNKLGFSLLGSDASGEPIYVKGVRGVVERNAVRYYLALTAFLTTRHLPAAARFEARIIHWFDETEKFRPQLHEMGRDKYLGAKRRERLNQLRLQEAVDSGRGLPTGAFGDEW